jgi:hypothetical protein
MVGRFLVCAMVACGQPEPPVKPVEITPVQTMPDASRPIDAPPADPVITISARPQMFTTKSGPGHVWFNVSNRGAATTAEVVSLEYLESGIASRVDIKSIRLGDTALPGMTFTVAPGDSILDVDFDTTMIPRVRDAYLFRVNVKADRVDISGESTVRYAQRIPHRP